MKLFAPRELRIVAALLMITVGICGLFQSRSGEILLTNQSFEIPSIADGVYRSGDVPGWSGIGTVGIGNPANDYFSGTTDGGGGTSPLNGLNAAAVNAGGKLSYQDPTLVVQPNVVYRLTLLVGHRNGVPLESGAFSFWAGADLLAEGSSSPPNDQFVAASLTYTSPPSGSLIGQPLRIELKPIGANSQGWFDDLHLFAGGGACTPHKAMATAQLVNGIFVGATITEPGCGYTNAPTVLIKGGGGNGATARAVITDGRVTEIRVTNGGCCYTNVPQIVIGSPPFVPSLSVNTSRINVTQNVVLGWKYVLESSTNSVDWTATGPAFVADSESIVTEFKTEDVGRFFRLRVVP